MHANALSPLTTSHLESRSERQRRTCPNLPFVPVSTGPFSMQMLARFSHQNSMLCWPQHHAEEFRTKGDKNESVDESSFFGSVEIKAVAKKKSIIRHPPAFPGPWLPRSSGPEAMQDCNRLPAHPSSARTHPVLPTPPSGNGPLHSSYSVLGA